MVELPEVKYDLIVVDTQHGSKSPSKSHNTLSSDGYDLEIDQSSEGSVRLLTYNFFLRPPPVRNK